MISVNLLPPEKKDEIKLAIKNSEAVKNLYFMIGILFVTIIILAVIYLYLQSELNKQKSTYAQKSQIVQKYGTLEDTARRISEKIDTIKKITNDGSSWSGVIEEINKIVPPGITLSSIKIDTNNKIRGTITGFSVSKNEVASLRDAVEKSDKFQYVDVENSTTQEDPITKREVESFTITFSLESGALK